VVNLGRIAGCGFAALLGKRVKAGDVRSSVTCQPGVNSSTFGASQDTRLSGSKVVKGNGQIKRMRHIGEA
jgi:hypothetical protein